MARKNISIETEKKVVTHKSYKELFKPRVKKMKKALGLSST